jgi:hypothetical protein
MREARIAAQLTHPNIAQIYDVGRHDGKLYITMQFIDGKTCNKADLGVREAAQVIRDASIAVDYAHARDIVHRDLKPHNIMVSEERSGTGAVGTSRRTYVMDFGLARSISKESSLTTEGQVLGTPAFMSPEQAEAGELDSRSDVYSLGASLYAMVTKRAPFEGSTPVQVLMMVAKGNPTPPSRINPQVDAGLESIILKSMALDPAQRYPSAGRLAADLSTWLEGGTPDAGPTIHLSSTPVIKRTVAAAAKPRKGLAVALVAALLVAGAGAAAVWFLKGAPEPAGAKKDPDPVKPPPGDFAAIDLDSQPQGATATLVGAAGRWTTPAKIRASEAPGGSASLTLSLPGYTTQTIHVTYTREAPARLTVPLLREPAPILRVESTPPDAVVRIDGRSDPAWRTPLTILDSQLSPGPHEVEVLLPGYEKAQKSVTLAAGRVETFEARLVPPKKLVAFTVESTPPGARVYVNNVDSGATPLTVYRDDVPGAEASVLLELKGYEPARRPVDLSALPRQVSVALEPQTGNFRVKGALARASLRLLPVVPGAKSMRTLASLWSENPEELAAALEKIDAAEASFVIDRLKELAPGRPRAAALAANRAAPVQLRPEQALAADAVGNATIEKAWVIRRYHLLASAPGAKDFVSDELQPLHREEVSVAVQMLLLGTVSVRTRPAAGRFTVALGDGSASAAVPAGGSVRVPSGPVVLRFEPPAGDPLLRPFAIPVPLGDRYELAGNLYILCARQAEKEGDFERAIRGYTKVLEEASYPASEEDERRPLPELVRGLVRAKIDASKPSGPASALAQNHARAREPYEAMEWFERAVAEGADPGAGAEGAVAAAVRGYPGLPARWEAASKSLAVLRAEAARRPGFLGVKASEVPDRGLRVDAVAKGSPAEAAGVVPGDFLVELGGKPIRTAADLEAAQKSLGEGAAAELKVDRGGEKRSLGSPKLAAAPAGEPAWAEPPAPGALRVGVVRNIHPEYGVFVALDPEVKLEATELLEVLRKGEPVGELAITRIAAADRTYPHGSAVCKRAKGAVEKGDEVRRVKR